MLNGRHTVFGASSRDGRLGENPAPRSTTKEAPRPDKIIEAKVIRKRPARIQAAEDAGVVQ